MDIAQRDLLGRQYTITVCIVLALLALTMLYKRGQHMVIDPLINSGLSEQQTRLYRYLVALHCLSRYDSHIEEAKTAEQAHQFIAANPAAVCVVCDRWYLAEMAHCPFHSVQTRIVSGAELDAQVLKWEDFRKRLVETSRIRNVTRVIAIRLHYFLDHVEER